MYRSAAPRGEWQRDSWLESLGSAPTFGDHLVLAWLATGLATIAGVLGSGLDSEDAVRRAAYRLPRAPTPRRDRPGQRDIESSSSS
jgi:hypothetical protein